LTVLASTALLAADTFPRTTELWEELDPADKTWAAWKKAYLAAHKKRADRLRATGGADYLGRANSAHSTTLNPSLLDSINNALNNLASAASNKKAILEQLIASNSSLAPSNSNLTNQVKTLRDQLAAKSRGGGSRGAGSNDPNKRRGPDPDGYCWSHGYRIGHGHNGHTCSHPKEDHQPTATCNNIMGGSVANKNKDWTPNRVTWGPGPVVQAKDKPTKTSYLLKSFYKLAFAASFSCSPPISNPSNLPVNYTGVADTGAFDIYFTKHAPINHRNTSASSIRVGTADGTIACSSASAQLKLTNLPPSACQGHIMPSFTRTLFGIVPLCDADLTVIFTKTDVKAINQARATILKGWRDPGGANNWHFPIIDSNYNSNEYSLFSSDDKLTSIPPPDPPPEPLPLPATPVPKTYWDRIRHKRRPAGTVCVNLTSSRDRLP
jgi:hypothetical protein